jgi:hypothetical protein
MSYPPGAAHDSRAPYNKPDSELRTERLKDVVCDVYSIEYDIIVNYWYVINDLGEHILKGYDHIPQKVEKIPVDILDEQVRDLISEHHDDKYSETLIFEC